MITPSLQLVPIAGRLVPCVEETMLLGRRVGVIQATGYVLSAIGYANRLSEDRAVGDLRRSPRRVEQFTELRRRPGPGADTAPTRLHPPRRRRTTGRPATPCRWRGTSASDWATVEGSC